MAQNLKKKVRELQNQLNQKNNEAESLKRHIKTTKIAEIEIEMKIYIDECARLRQ